MLAKRIASGLLATFALVATAHAGSGWSNTFPPGNGLNGAVRALLAFDDGSGPALFVGGDFTTAGGFPASHIAKWDGVSWSALGLGVDGPVHALVVFDDGTGPALHVGGDFIHAGGGAANRIAKWDGANWFHLGSWTDQLVRTLAVAQFGAGTANLYAGGPAGVARWTGTSWLPVPGINPVHDLNALAFYPGYLYAAGTWLEPGMVSRGNGSSWSAVGWIEPSSVYAMAFFDSGDGLRLYVGGDFTDPAIGVARSWGPWLPLAGSPAGVYYSLAVHDGGDGPALYAGGTFTFPFQRIARWDGSTWSGLGEGIAGGNVLSMATFDDGSGPALYAAGDFTVAGGMSAERIARWCCAPPASITFCQGTDTACPCDGGNPGAGCQTATGTGGVTLSVLSQEHEPNGAVLLGTGYASMGSPTALVIRSASLDPARPVVFGDGIRCLSISGLVRMAATVGVGGVSTHFVGHLTNPGTFYYQLWFRDNPSTYCDPSTAFNLSSGRTLTW